MQYKKRYQLMFGALLSVAGGGMREEFQKQEDLVKMLAAIADKVKASKDKEVGDCRVLIPHPVVKIRVPPLHSSMDVGSLLY